jgi:hypothetical protein
MRIVERIEDLKTKVSTGYRSICQETGIVYSSFMRWKGRTRRGDLVVNQPGPKKHAFADRNELDERIKQLPHRNKLTLGSGQLYAEYQQCISRREFTSRVRKQRDLVKQEKLKKMRRITWHVPGMAWAMDDTGKRGLPVSHKISLHQVRDLSSRLALSAHLTPRMLCSEQVADNLEELFWRHGAPLILKCDNGSNLNGDAVRDLLDAYGVILLNNPPHYPRYNGHLEYSQRELKAKMAGYLEATEIAISPDWSTLKRVTALSVRELNLTPRPCLRGRTATDIYRLGHPTMKSYTLSRRKEMIDEIKTAAQQLRAQMGDGARHENVAWRIAVENWLHKHGLIGVSLGSKVSPNFPPHHGLINWLSAHIGAIVCCPICRDTSKGPRIDIYCRWLPKR